MSKFSDSGSESSYESDAESDVGHSSNMMSIFANYYGIEASTPEAAVGKNVFLFFFITTRWLLIYILKFLIK